MTVSGAGRGAIARDGSPVELYLALPHLGEADIVHAAIPAGAPILELGCGVGRVTRPLAALGHPVVAVDESEDMLAYVPGARPVCSTIAELDLDETFPVVLLASHLVNTTDDGARGRLLAAARRHLDSDGILVVEWHPPEWFASVHDGDGGSMGPVEVRLVDVALDGDVLSATVRYTTDADLWTHPFTALRLSEARLGDELAAHGLCRDAWLTQDHTWFTARVS